jgi:hypothetical protein
MAYLVYKSNIMSTIRTNQGDQRRIGFEPIDLAIIKALSGLTLQNEAKSDYFNDHGIRTEPKLEIRTISVKTNPNQIISQAIL